MPKNLLRIKKDMIKDFVNENINTNLLDELKTGIGSVSEDENIIFERALFNLNDKSTYDFNNNFNDLTQSNLQQLVLEQSNLEISNLEQSKQKMLNFEDFDVEMSDIKKSDLNQLNLEDFDLKKSKLEKHNTISNTENNLLSEQSDGSLEPKKKKVYRKKK